MGLLDKAHAGWAAQWGLAGALWGLVGLLGLLLYALVRLTDVVVAGLDYDWHWHHVALAGANAVFMAWSEGLRAFSGRSHRASGHGSGGSTVTPRRCVSGSHRCS